MTQLIACSAVHIMCHCYIICHMLRLIDLNTLGPVVKVRSRRLGVMRQGFYANRVCAHVLHGEHGRHGPIAIAGGGQYTLYLLQTLTHMM